MNQATSKQQDLLEVLAIDLGYTTRMVRNARISEFVGRSVSWLDQLSIDEADQIIKSWIKEWGVRRTEAEIQKEKKDDNV